MGRRSRNHTYVKYIILLDKAGQVGQRFELDNKGKLKIPLSPSNHHSNSGITDTTSTPNSITITGNSTRTNYKVESTPGMPLPLPQVVTNNTSTNTTAATASSPATITPAVEIVSNVTSSTPSSPPPQSSSSLKTMAMSLPVYRSSSIPITPMMRAKPSLFDMGLLNNNPDNTINNINNRVAGRYQSGVELDNINVIDIRPQRLQELQAF